jgi:hypothetical protein
MQTSPDGYTIVTISLIRIYYPILPDWERGEGHATYHLDATPPPKTAYLVVPGDSLWETSTQQGTHPLQTAFLPVPGSMLPSTVDRLQRQDLR